MLKLETWKRAIIDNVTIPYYVSSIGNVKTLDGKLLSQRKNNRNYSIISVKVDNKVKNVLVHRLVACTFIPNPLNKRTVNHIDGNKDNNSYWNLEWMSYSENNKHAYDTGLHKSLAGEDSPFAKVSVDLVRKICSELEVETSVGKICKKLNVSRNLVNSIRDKRAWTTISSEYKIIPHPKRHFTNSKLKAIIIDLFMDGNSIEAICKLLGWKTERKYLRRIKRILKP